MVNAKAQKKSKKGGTKKKAKSAVKSKKSSGNARPRGFTPMEMMIMDPCNSPTEPVQQAYMEGGVVFRVRTRYPIHQLSTANAGMFLWDPTYFNAGTDGSFKQTGGVGALYGGGGNVFMYETDSTNSVTPPVNTFATPLGSGTATTSATGRCLPDPAYPTMAGNNGNYSAATLIGACMHVGYTGPTSANSGEICFISNYPSSNLVGAATNLPSVQQLLTYGRRPVRVGSANELVYRPNDLADRMRTIGQTCQGGPSLTGVPGALGYDCAIAIAKVAGTGESTCGLDSASKMFGVSWVNLNTSQASDVYIECTKIFQVQLRAQSGTQEPSPAASSAISSQAAVESIDSKWGGTGWDWIGELVGRGVKAGVHVAQAYRGYRRGVEGSPRLANLALGGW